MKKEAECWKSRSYKILSLKNLLLVFGSVSDNFHMRIFLHSEIYFMGVFTVTESVYDQDWRGRARTELELNVEHA